MTKLLRAVTVISCLLGLYIAGCTPTAPPLPPVTEGGGWDLITVFIGITAPLQIVKGVTLHGVWLEDGPGPAAGNASPFTVTTGADGTADVVNGRVPAKWEVTWQNGVVNADDPFGCIGKKIILTPSIAHRQETVFCIETPAVTAGFSFNPNPLLADNPPSVVQIAGNGFSATYGMPLVQYFDSNGTLVAQMQATAIAPDGTWIQAPTPNMQSIPLGVYAGVIKNANASGGWDLIGVVDVQVDVTPPPPTPPEPCSGHLCINQC